jgi:hypothetical protein
LSISFILAFAVLLGLNLSHDLGELLLSRCWVMGIYRLPTREGLAGLD